MAFTLKPNRWYGWQMIPGYVGERCVPFCCPCHVRSVTPQKSGKGLLTLEVWITGYAEGVNMGEVELKVIHRGDTYLIAQILYPPKAEINRCVVISEIEFEWVRRFCPELWQEMAVPVHLLFAPGSAQSYLQEFYRTYDAWHPDLLDEAVIFCALRFDGGKLDEELNRETPSQVTYGNFSRLHEEHFAAKPWRLHPDPLMNWGEFYWLQRSHKWSGLDREAARLMAWLFTQLHDQPVPRGYEQAEYAEKYQRLKPSAVILAAEWAALLAAHTT